MLTLLAWTKGLSPKDNELDPKTEKDEFLRDYKRRLKRSYLGQI